MTITVNGEAREFPEEELSLRNLLEFLGLGSAPVLVEHNGVALFQREQAAAVIRSGDRVEILRVVAGG